MIIERQLTMIPNIAPTDIKNLTVLSSDNNPTMLKPTDEADEIKPITIGCFSKLSYITLIIFLLHYIGLILHLTIYQSTHLR